LLEFCSFLCKNMHKLLLCLTFLYLILRSPFWTQSVNISSCFLINILSLFLSYLNLWFMQVHFYMLSERDIVLLASFLFLNHAMKDFPPFLRIGNVLHQISVFIKVYISSSWTYFLSNSCTNFILYSLLLFYSKSK
jgi:hypothetical protein